MLTPPAMASITVIVFYVCILKEFMDANKCKVTVPRGQLGHVKIETFEISEFESLLSIKRDGPARMILPGSYTRLIMDGRVMMSDSQAEIADHRVPIELANGHCLIAGLGLGMVVQAMLTKPEVTKVTVIENCNEVIELVAPHYYKLFGDRFEVIHDSIFTWEPPADAFFDVAWFDIWISICEDNYPEMSELLSKFESITCWQGCWAQDMVKMLVDNDLKGLVKELFNYDEDSSYSGTTDYMHMLSSIAAHG